MTKREKATVDALSIYIRERKTSESQKSQLYADFFSLRGQGCADHAMSLIRGYRGAPDADLVDVDTDCHRLLTTYAKPRESMTWQSILCVSSFLGMTLVLIALITLSIAGKTVPTDQRYLVSLLMGLLVGALVIGGTSTASVKASMPASKGAKVAISLGGAGAGVVGTVVIFHWLGY